MYYHFCLFHYRFLLVEKLIITSPTPPPPPLAPPCLVYLLWRSEIFTPRFYYGMWGVRCEVFLRDVRWIPERGPVGTCDFIVISSWLLLDLCVSVGVSLRVCFVLLVHLWSFVLLDCYWVTTSVILLAIIVSFLCTTLTMFMCFA